jgi:periplasmic protein TonB
MRWSMLPVSAAAHAAVFVVVFITAASGGALPTPWPVAGIRDYIPVAPTPPAIAVQVKPNRAPDSAAPIKAADTIANDPLPTPADVPVVEGGLDGGSIGSNVAPPSALNLSPPPPPPAPDPEPQPRKIHPVGGAIREPKKIVDVPVVYPEIARQARVEGLVLIEATIDERGFVVGARVLRSVPLLDAAALAAVKQWRYTPTLLNGAPIPVLMTITFNFKLGDRVP